MAKPVQVKRRRQFCTRCGQLMFEYYCSLDGHFGLIDALRSHGDTVRKVFLCPTCGARYRWLDRMGPLGQPAVRA
jgi:ribosomal protein S27AE